MTNASETHHEILYSTAAALEGILARWHDTVQRHAVWVVLLAVMLALATTYYVVENLRVNTDTTDMLSKDLPWRATYIRYKHAFPQYYDNVVVVIDGDTPDQAQDAAQLLASRLHQETRLFKNIYLPEHSSFFRKNQLLYLSVEELEDLADNLAQVQPFLAKLAWDQTLRGIFSMLSDAVAGLLKGETYKLETAFMGLSEVIVAHNQGQRRPLSWQELMSGKDAEAKDRRVILIAKPRLDYSEVFPGKPAVEFVRKLAKELRLTPESGVRLRLTGGATMEY